MYPASDAGAPGPYLATTLNAEFAPLKVYIPVELFKEVNPDPEIYIVSYTNDGS
jgi:hypothetical protein